MDYIAPRSIGEAVTVLQSATSGAQVLAGGTDLIIQLKTGGKRPGLLVDIKKIPEANAIKREADGSVRIGAAAPIARLARNADFSTAWPGLLEAARLIGSEQIQGRATIGGNICNASPAADTVPPLICAEATCAVAGPTGIRNVSVEKISNAPGRTSLEPGEFVVSIHLPRPAKRSSLTYIRFIPRTEMDIAVVGAAVSVTVDDEGKCAAARVALGAVAPTVVLVEPAAVSMLGSDLGDDIGRAVQVAVREACNPIDDMRGTAEFRTHLAGVLAARAMKAAADGARASR